MYPETLPKKTARLLEKLKTAEFLKPFYLSGGTALSLQLGHRESEDLDFFNKKPFDPLSLQPQLGKFGHLTAVRPDKNTLNLFLSGVQLQFLFYPYRLLKPLAKWQTIRIASVLDIGCTKLQTIAARGSKKDFIDLFMILKKYSLVKLFSSMEKKYRGSDYNLPHILKSLTFFADAENQPLPRMRIKADWEEIKESLIGTIKDFKF